MSDHAATVRRFSETTEARDCAGLVVCVEGVRPKPYQPPRRPHLAERY